MIRKAIITDSSAIQQLNKYQLGYDYSSAKTTKNLKRLLSDSQHHYIFVFEDDITKKVNGYVHAEIYEETYFDQMFNILALAVNTSFQKKGIGKQLMLKLEEKARELCISEIRLNSGESRLDAHKFYENLGYITNKKQKRFSKKL